MLFYANLIFPFSPFLQFYHGFQLFENRQIFGFPRFPPFLTDVPSVLLIFNKNCKNAWDIRTKRSVRTLGPHLSPLPAPSA